MDSRRPSHSRQASDRPLLINTLLFVIIVVLVNVGVARMTTRVDLTRNNEYSLTELTREVLLQANEPVRVRLYFSPDLPPQYESALQHAVDLLQEYRRNASTPFSILFADVEDPDVVAEAEALGVRPVEIQQIESDQFRSRSVYMAIVTDYAGLVEIINPVTERYGIEYRLTDGLARLVRRQQAYQSPELPLQIRFVYTPELEELGVPGIEQLALTTEQTLETLGTTVQLAYDLELVAVTGQAAVNEAADAYGLPRIRWRGETGQEQAGILAVVILGEETQGEASPIETVPIAVRRAEGGSIQTESPFSVQRRIVRSVDVATGVIPRLGYVTGHGEPSLADSQTGAAAFGELASARYELVELRLEEEQLPAGLAGLIVTTPRTGWSDAALARLEEYLERGGNLLALIDPYVLEQSTAGDEAEWRRTSPKLLALLEKHGIRITPDLVLDERSFVGEQNGVRRALLQAPLIQGRDINRVHPLTAGLDDVVLFNPAVLEPASPDQGYTVLLRSSERSWVSREPEFVGPWIEEAPQGASFGSRDLAAIVNTGGVERDGMETSGASIIVVGTSALTAAPMLSGADRLTNRVFVENLLDGVAGFPGFASLRTKGLTQPRLDETSPAMRTMTRIFGIVVPIALLGVAALAVFAARRRRRKRIRETYGGGA